MMTMIAATAVALMPPGAGVLACAAGERTASPPSRSRESTPTCADRRRPGEPPATATAASTATSPTGCATSRASTSCRRQPSRSGQPAARSRPTQRTRRRGRPAQPPPRRRPPPSATTYGEDDLIGAAEGVFGKGAQGARPADRGHAERSRASPMAISSGAKPAAPSCFGVRYGSGTLYHKIEGQMPVYWTGPSIGFDAGANAAQHLRAGL